MRFVWRRVRTSYRSGIAALATAVLITFVAGAFVALTVLTVRPFALARRDVSANASVERLSFVSIARPVPVIRRADRSAGRPSGRHEGPADARGPAIPAAPNAAASNQADVNARADTRAPASDASSALSGSALSPSAFSYRSGFAKRVRDSAMEPFTIDMTKLSQHVEKSQAELDSLGREDARRWADAKDQHRPVAIPGGVGLLTFSVPLFSRGPSKDERRRDSALHADYTRHLATFLERSKARKDSVRTRDSIAMLTKTRSHPANTRDTFSLYR